MNSASARACFAALILTTAVSCTKSPAAPTAADVTTVSPVPVTPANNASVKHADQPITLVVTNAVGKAGLTYSFEVATDVAFAALVQAKDSIAEGTNGQTSVKIDALPPGRDYYWRSRAKSGATPGNYGIAARFVIGPAVTINAPVPISPLTNSQTATRPAFRVVNAVRTGVTGAITYTFEIATTPAFSALLTSTTVGEGVNETGFIPTTDLPMSNNLLYWRATANDASNATSSPASTVQSFTVPVSQAGQIAQQRGVVLWPGTQPPGSVGHATLGPGWDVKTIRDFKGKLVPSPKTEQLRIFDLLDRGMTPDGAIGWMKANGYSTDAVYYAEVLSIGFDAHYMTFLFGAWELVIRSGA